MARNITEDMNETEADETEQGALPESDPFLDVLRDINALKTKGKKISGDMSARLTRAEAAHNLNKKAFRIVASCTRMEQDELHSFLRHFDKYREYAGLDATAGTDLFEGATSGPEKAASEPKGRGRPKAPKAAKPPKAAKKAKEATGKRRGRSPKNKAPSAGAFASEAEPVSAVEAAATLWGMNKDTETAGAA